jgi:hypothetical protein
MAEVDARRTYKLVVPVKQYYTCPSCDERISLKVLLETDDPRFFSKQKTATDIAEDVQELMKLHDDEGLFGKPTDNRSIVLACYKPPFIHYKVNGRNRLICLKRLW